MAVEFCTQCNQSLPVGDLSFKDGKALTSRDYVCPNCGKIANPDTTAASAAEPSTEKDLVIRGGDASIA